MTNNTPVSETYLCGTFPPVFPRSISFIHYLWGVIIMWGVFYDADAPRKRVVIRRVFLGVFMDRFMDFTAHHHYAMSEGRVGGLGGGGWRGRCV